jgi:hypothetical protein
MASLAPVSPEQPSLSGDCGGDGKELQAVQKPTGQQLFAWPEPGIDFDDIDRAAAKGVVLLDPIGQEFRAPVSSVAMVKRDD